MPAPHNSDFKMTAPSNSGLEMKAVDSLDAKEADGVSKMSEAKNTNGVNPPQKRRYLPIPPSNFTGYGRNGMLLEEIELYLPGGFHPVHIGDVLDGKYEVAHKLGSGGFATVWLCLDTVPHCWKAIKILVAEKSSESCPEIKFKDILGDSNFVAMPERHFWIDGPNGRHLALVLPVLGPSISQTRDLVSDTASIRKVCCRLAESLQYLHSKGICHADFRPSNILHKMHSIDSLSKEQLWELLGAPTSWEYRQTVATIDKDDTRPNGPRYVVRSADMRRLQDWIITDEIAIIDFGIAYKELDTAEGAKEIGIPLPFAAPELFFDGCHSTRSDVWSLACSILRLQCDRGFSPTLWDIVNDMEFYFGPLPEEFRQAFTKAYPPAEKDESEDNGFKNEYQIGNEDDYDYDYEDFYDFSWPKVPVDPELEKNYLTWKPKELQDKRKEMLKSTGFSDLFNATLARDGSLGGFGYLEKRAYRLSRCEVVQLGDLLRKMLRYDPEKRLSASQVLDHPWFAQYRRATQPEASKETSLPQEVKTKLQELMDVLRNISNGALM
ncbi:kinase-like domain-containing protein [Hypoxylon sp. FL0543]|nr:kinase-like domain-containing protein [Hypoxylon sp. FL0543]